MNCQGAPSLALRHSDAHKPLCDVVRRSECLRCSDRAHRAPSRRSTRLRSASSAAAADGPSTSQSSWDSTTDRLVASSSIPFSILVVPQAVQNLVCLSQGNAAALAIISWESYITGLVGNTLMCTHFASHGERSAVNVQLIGMTNNIIILSQVALTGFMPLPAFACALSMTLLAVVINTGRLQGRFPDSSDKGGGTMGVWRTWQLLAGAFGIAVVPQVLVNLLLPGQLGLLPGVATLVLLLGSYFFLRMRDQSSKQDELFQMVGQLPGWGATLLFALSPLPQLVRNFLEPQSLEGLSVGTMLLCLVGNALMLPRALFTRDSVWIAGACWGCLANWGQLLSMFLGTSAGTGQRHLAAAPFAVATTLLVAWVVMAIVVNSRHRSKA